MPTRDSPTSRIGNSITRPKTRNIVVTKSKYGPAAMFATSVLVREAQQERDRVRQDHVRDPDPEREEEQRERDPRADGLPLRWRQAGRDERPDLVKQDRHRQDDPDDDRDPQLDREPIARARTWTTPPGSGRSR